MGARTSLSSFLPVSLETRASSSGEKSVPPIGIMPAEELLAAVVLPLMLMGTTLPPPVSS